MLLTSSKLYEHPVKYLKKFGAKKKIRYSLIDISQQCQAESIYDMTL